MDNELHILLNKRFNILLNSYKTLKVILIPNLPSDKNSFMKIFLDIILSQINLFIRISTLKTQNKIFDLINNNIQVLSKSIISFYNLFSNINNTSIEQNSKGKFLEFNYNIQNKTTFSKNLENLKNSKNTNLKSPKKKKTASFVPLKLRLTEVNTRNPFNYTQYDNDNFKHSFTSRKNYKTNYTSTHKDLRNKNINIKKNEKSPKLYGKSTILKEDNFTKIFNTSILQKDEVYSSICSTNRSMKNKNNSKQKIIKSYTNIKNFKKIRKKVAQLPTKKINFDNNKNNFNYSNNFTEKFNLSDFLIPCKSKNKDDTKKLYITKDGNITINENQKNILEKYINKCANETFSKTHNIQRNKYVNKITNTFCHLKKNSNKKISLTDNCTNNGINNKSVKKLLNHLPKSFQKNIEDYVFKKRIIDFNKDVFNNCYNSMIDSYKEMKDKKKKNDDENKIRYKSNNYKVFVVHTEPEPTLKRMKSKKNFQTEPNPNVNNKKEDN